MRNLLTIDVEEYFQVEAFAGVVDRRDWVTLESRVAPATERLLGLLERTRQKATFFVLGWTAERHPELVEKPGFAMVEMSHTAVPERPTNLDFTRQWSVDVALHEVF